MAKNKYEVIVTTRTVPLPPERVPAWRESARIFLDLADKFYQNHPDLAGDDGFVESGEKGTVQNPYSGEFGNLEVSREPEIKPVFQGAAW